VESGFALLSTPDIWKFRVLLPPRDEQMAIVAFLDRETERTDALVAKVQPSTLIEIINERFGATFTPADELFFSQIREEDGDVIVKHGSRVLATDPAEAFARSSLR